VKRIVTITIVLGQYSQCDRPSCRPAGASRHPGALPVCPGHDQGRRQLGRSRLQRPPQSLVRPLGVQRRRHLAPRSRALGLRHGGFCNDPVWTARHTRRGPARLAPAVSMSMELAVARAARGTGPTGTERPRQGQRSSIGKAWSAQPWASELAAGSCSLPLRACTQQRPAASFEGFATGCAAIPWVVPGRANLVPAASQKRFQSRRVAGVERSASSRGSL
jgi:hypothetical protein